MLIHPWDAATEPEWRDVLRTHDFGLLIASGRNRDFPAVVPTHFAYADDQIWMHFAKPNPIWEAIDENPHVVFAVTADWAYVEAAWNTLTDPQHGVPTSYYTSVHLHCLARPVDQAGDIAELLTDQLSHFEPGDSQRVAVSIDHEGDRRLLKAIRGLRLQIVEVRAKQKYGGNKSVMHRHQIAERLTARARPGDERARAHLLRRTPDSPDAAR